MSEPRKYPAAEPRKYTVYYHEDLEAENWDEERFAVWSDVPYFRIMGCDLPRLLREVRGTLLCAIGLYESPPMSLQFEEVESKLRWG